MYILFPDFSQLLRLLLIYRMKLDAAILLQHKEISNRLFGCPNVVNTVFNVGAHIPVTKSFEYERS